MAHGSDFVGRPCSREEVAEGLGFHDVAALDRWDIWKRRPKDEQIDILLGEVANLIALVKELQGRVVSLESRLAGFGPMPGDRWAE